ncbi:putative golgi phosphoprotein 3 (GPP34) [Lyophyllum shimeji]|uniref:Golgi phosphoprotein 3 (GPP34) n=1 Tax=Lyophyllum shimeji TaxID=47721 RepID=A0A9P3UQJ1_LYOSH|nr:putative golgi phosphoprotein 3 (GPP34) [Lyophyllum shimeji]
MEFRLLDSVAEAAEKYQVWTAMDACLDRMKNTLPQHADSILVYAKKHGYTELMDLAAIPLLDQDFERVLGFLPDALTKPWAIYHNKWSVVQLQACTLHNQLYSECTNSGCRNIQSRMAKAVSAVTSPQILEEIPAHLKYCGETWNVMKIGFQLKQVRERLAKGLVDKGVLRTEKRNFLLFDMATHPVADVRTKESIISRAVALLTSTTASIPPAALDREGMQCRILRAYEKREAAFGRCDEILAEFSCWPFGSADGYGSSGGTAAAKRRLAARIGSGSVSGEVSGREAVMGLVTEVRKEALGEEDLGFELVAGVRLEVLSKLDSLL